MRWLYFTGIARPKVAYELFAQRLLVDFSAPKPPRPQTADPGSIPRLTSLPQLRARNIPSESPTMDY